jgi:dihydropyrimidinase
VCEAEAINRLIACAELVDQPIMIFHVSTAEGCAVIRQKRGEGLKVFAETCPQYLFFTRHDLDKPGYEGAKWMFSPPAREKSDQEAIWQALDLGDLQLISSDHAPYAYDQAGKTGKFSAGPSPTFKQIANGMPGVTPRMPLMFDAMVTKGRGGINRFVSWTATEPAKIYGLAPKKGSIAVGADADIAVWDPKKKVTFSDDTIKDGSGYSPYAGHTVTGWPVTVVRRGEVIVEGDSHSAKAGSGRFIARKAGWAAEPLGRTAAEFNPKTNFGAKLG